MQVDDCDSSCGEFSDPDADADADGFSGSGPETG